MFSLHDANDKFYLSLGKKSNEKFETFIGFFSFESLKEYLLSDESHINYISDIISDNLFVATTLEFEKDVLYYLKYLNGITTICKIYRESDGQLNYFNLSICSGKVFTNLIDVITYFKICICYEFWDKSIIDITYRKDIVENA